VKKILYVVLDGLGDRPMKELGGKTPTEAANIPNMNRLAKSAKAGLLYTVGKGIAPESDIAVISILGYDAEKYYTGRGPIEAAAMRLKLSPGDVAHRCNFATHGEKMSIVDRRVGRDLSDAEAAGLADEVNAKVKLSSVPGARISPAGSPTATRPTSGTASSGRSARTTRTSWTGSSR